MNQISKLNFRKVLFAVVLFCSSMQLASSQKLTHVQGQFIVQLDADVSIKRWLNDFNLLHNYNIKLDGKVTPILNIYTVNYDYTKHNEGRIHTDLLMHKNVEVAQFNHFVKLRSTIPNDPEFTNQWQYINLGQDGGTVGADIDIDLAWDYATGGVTADGDTIVACIIDDGVDNDHPDMLPNLFLNYAEIPDNGIDDDNNGFIDDFRGWDTGSNTDNVYDGGGHGTPVAGIIGAKGNDGFGVAGVNWDAKLMIVQGGTGVESEVIEAYSYPLAFRKKYNETDGAEGAFVVSTNASWGIDFGNPADAPLWCAFYDTLGAAGIISCGATINGNQNVDEIGDLPTACPSDYLISVTNMNRTDNKVTGAGYGLETIDLGAFGADTWTVQIGGGFSGFGGTSGATPHVTGTIALMYSLPCPNLILLAKNDPAAAATLVRQTIFDGVDANASLEGITTTGGRLNVNNTALLLLQNYCGDCLAPFVDSEEIIDDTSMEISFSLNDTTEFVELRIKEQDSTEWVELGQISSPYTFTDLELCRSYEYQLKSICTNSEGEYGISNTFESFGCCLNPEIPTISDVNENSATLTWDSISAATSYNLQYRPIGAINWLPLVSDGSTLQLTDLLPCTNYEVQIQSDCILESPAFSESSTFFTVGCSDPCTQLPYCDIQGYNSSEEWIASVEINELNNVTQGNGGYGDFTSSGPTTDLSVGGSYYLRVDVAFEGNSFDEYFNVYIDYNQDGAFNEEEELVVSVGPVSEQIEEVITIPSDISFGNTRMRIAMRYNQLPNACTQEGFSDFGETEDYCVNITAFQCPINITIDTVMVTSNSAELQWDENLNVFSYEYRYKQIINTEWITGATSDNGINLAELVQCTEYEFQLKSLCEGTESDFGDSYLFETSCVNNSESEQFSNIKVYPNPFDQNITIDISSLVNRENINYSIINQLGQTVISGVLNSSQSINVKLIPAGMYYVQLEKDQSIIAQVKLVKL